MQPAEFSFSFNPLMRVLMTPLLSGQRRSTIRVDGDNVVVRMGLGGWAFSAVVPRAAIVEARRVEGPVWAWGAHGWRGRWLVNGSGRGLVQLTMPSRVRARCLVFPLRVRELTLSLDDPDAFVHALSPTG